MSVHVYYVFRNCFNKLTAVYFEFESMLLKQLTIYCTVYIGRLGTLLGNFLKDIEVSTGYLLENFLNDPKYSEYFYLGGIEKIPPWNQPYFKELKKLYPNWENFEYFTHIVGNITKDKDLKVSPLDVAPILTPVEDYLTGKKYSQQFRWTVAEHMWNKGQEPLVIEGVKQKFASSPPDFLKEKNYFGKVLGKHFEFIMEVMYHSILRPGPLRKNWMFHRVYGGNLKDALYFNSTLTSKPFALNIEDYISKASFPYMPIHEDIVYGIYNSTHDYPQEYHTLFSGHPDFSDYLGVVTTNLNLSHRLNFSLTEQDIQLKDLELENMRQKFQPRQFIMACKIHGSDEICQDSFVPVLTNNGICYAYNGQNFHQSLRDTAYNKHFKSIFGVQEKVFQTDEENALGSGFNMFLILDSHQSSVDDYDSGYFEVAINQRSDIHSVRKNAVKVRIGQETIIKSTAITQYTDTKNFQKLSQIDRGCANEDEFEDSLVNFRYCMC